jgi:hypothetical protein
VNLDNGTDDFWWPEDSTSREAPRAKHSRKTWIVAGIGAIAIAALSVAVINVASSHTATAGGNSTGFRGGGAPPGVGRNGPGGRGNVGTIAAIDGATITLTTQTGTTKVVTSANTTVSLSVAGAIGDIKTGDHVVVTGAASGTTVAADRIVDLGTNATSGFGGPGGGLGGPPGGNPPAGARQGNGGFVTGTVAAIDGTSFTITATNGTSTKVTTTSSTQVTKEKTGSLQDLITGDQVTVIGPTGSDGTVTATAIRQGGMR